MLLVINVGFFLNGRLLGPAAHDFPNSAGQALASTFRDTRVVVMDNGLGILTNSEEEQIDFVVSKFLFSLLSALL